MLHTHVAPALKGLNEVKGLLRKGDHVTDIRVCLVKGNVNKRPRMR